MSLISHALADVERRGTAPCAEPRPARAADRRTSDPARARACCSPCRACSRCCRRGSRLRGRLCSDGVSRLRDDAAFASDRRALASRRQVLPLWQRAAFGASLSAGCFAVSDVVFSAAACPSRLRLHDTGGGRLRNRRVGSRRQRRRLPREFVEAFGRCDRGLRSGRRARSFRCRRLRGVSGSQVSSMISGFGGARASSAAARRLLRHRRGSGGLVALDRSSRLRIERQTGLG